MKKTSLRINNPFDVTYELSFSGRTKSDGEFTVTAQMVRDKLLHILDEMQEQGHIREYRVSVVRNNIEEANKVVKRSKEQ
jgi:hypothetical protein